MGACSLACGGGTRTNTKKKIWANDKGSKCEGSIMWKKNDICTVALVSYKLSASISTNVCVELEDINSLDDCKASCTSNRKT